MLMNPNGRVVALFGLFFSLNLMGFSQTTPPPVHPTSPGSGDQIEFSTTVVNGNGDLVTEALPKNNFQVFINKKPADVVDLRVADAPVSVGIIVDASGSIGDPLSTHESGVLFKNSQQALGTFMKASNPSNEYFLMAFNAKPQLLVDWTSDPKAIVDTVGILPTKGNTAFYDACYLALDKVRHGRHQKRVLILITDGEDNISTYSSDQVRDELRTSDVLVYTVAVAGSFPGSLGILSESRDALRVFSSVSGGWFFYRRDGKPLPTSDAVAAFETIAQELRHQYTIVVNPSASSNDRKWHKIKVKITSPVGSSRELKNLSARTREGFYLNHR